jgi:hypothetical protein
MDQQAPQRRAALAGGAHRGEGDRALCQRQVGRRSYHHRIVAA